MEILMKLKCSPSAPGAVPHSTLKVVDHHNQLQQHTLTSHGGSISVASGGGGGGGVGGNINVSGGIMRAPPNPHSATSSPSPSSAIAAAAAAAHHQRAAQVRNSRQEAIPITTCLEYASPMDCCSSASATHHDLSLIDAQWSRQRASNDYAGNCDMATCCRAFEPPPPCCSATYGGLTPPPPAHSLLSQPAAHRTHRSSNVATPVPAANVLEDQHTRYEYQEPEENFISIDDAKIKGFLLRIGEENRKNNDKNRMRANAEKASLNAKPIVYEIIELDDEEEREKLKRIKDQVERNTPVEARPQRRLTNSSGRRNNSPSISLIPKEVAVEIVPRTVKDATKHKIIAQIELLDSDSETESTIDNNKQQTTIVEKDTGRGKNKVSENVVVEEKEEEADADDEEGEEEEEEMPLAAAAVSCELDDDDTDENENENDNANDTLNEDSNTTSKSERDDGAIVVLPSDDENVEFIDEHEEGPELRWDDLEEQQQRERTYFECFLCGKKVQSSYNLRRHMMIHTGERPFGCDLCDRRFREFSDLKKHRRRHANEANFVCMVCRVNAATEADPTRCSSCDSKSGVILAATRQSKISSSASNASTTDDSNLTLPPTLTRRTPSRQQQSASQPQQTLSISSSGSISSPSSSTLPPPPPLTITVPKGTQVSAAPPPLTPIHNTAASSTSPTTSTSSNSNVSGAQSLLDTLPAVHRSSYNQLGVITRKEFPCPLCQRPFGTRHNLKRHFMIHTGEKPFSCPKCRKPFREYSTLKKHMVTHQRDRWYKCLRCPQKYRDYLQYTAHRGSHPAEEMPHSSSGSSSSNAASPKKRNRLNGKNDDYYEVSNDDDDDEDDSSSEAWLECCECCQRFTDIETYTEHLKEHDPSLYLYECYICKTTFETRPELMQHMPSHDEDCVVARTTTVTTVKRKKSADS